jgi:hypothetical protein
MLGLGNSISTGAWPNPIRLLHSYTSDFSSGTDGWTLTDSIEGTPNFSGGANPPGITSTNDWYKMEFTENQTGMGLISRDFDDPVAPLVSSAGDYADVSYEIYLEGDWDPASGGDDVQILTQFMGAASWIYVPLGQVTTISINGWPAPSEWSGDGVKDQFKFYFLTGGDLPLDEDAMYLRNISVQIYGTGDASS